MKVKTTEDFKYYRNAVLGLKKEDYRALQAGKEVDIDSKLIKKYPQIFEVEIKPKEVKDGDK